MIGRLINLLTCVTQPTRLKLNRWLGAGVSDVETWSLLCLPRLAAGPSSNPSLQSLNGQLHYPPDLDRPLTEVAADKIIRYRADYNRPSHAISCLLLLVRLDASTVSLCSFYFCRLIGKLTAFLQLQEFSLRNPPFTTVAWRSPRRSSLKLVVRAAALRITLNIDGAPIASRSHLTYHILKPIAS
jgi:hypothetical protein